MPAGQDSSGWTMDQKNTLLYRVAERNSSLDFMADILQQKEVRENKTKPQINLQARGNVTHKTRRKLHHLS